MDILEYHSTTTLNITVYYCVLYIIPMNIYGTSLENWWIGSSCACPGVTSVTTRWAPPATEPRPPTPCWRGPWRSRCTKHDRSGLRRCPWELYRVQPKCWCSPCVYPVFFYVVLEITILSIPGKIRVVFLGLTKHTWNCCSNKNGK